MGNSARVFVWDSSPPQNHFELFLLNSPWISSTFAWSHTPNHFGPLSVLRSPLDPWRGLRRVSRFSARKRLFFCIHQISRAGDPRDPASWLACFSRDILDRKSTRQPRKLFFFVGLLGWLKSSGTLGLIRPTGSLHQSFIPLWAYQVFPLDAFRAIPAATANLVLRLDHNYCSSATGPALFSSHHNSLYNSSLTHTLSLVPTSVPTPLSFIFIACLQPPIMRH